MAIYCYIGILKVLDMLIKAGHYDINKSETISRYGEDVFGPWMKLEDTVEEMLSESDQRIAQSEEYRAIRKASRGRAVGGGFGLKGAVGGMVTAGAFNALSGLAHSGANAIGNARTRSKERDRLNQLYESPLIIDCIQEVFDESFRGMAWVFLTYPDRPLPYIGTVENLSRAEALRENFEKIPAEKQPEMAALILSLAPAVKDTYQLLLTHYQDPEGILGRLAKAVGMENTYRELVEQSLAPKVNKELEHFSARMQNLNIEDVDTPKAAHIREECLQNLQTICAEYNLKTGAGEALLEKYNQRLEDTFRKGIERIRTIDRQQRTFRNTVYETVALADQAKQIWEKVNALEASCDEKSSAQLREDLTLLQSLMNQAPEALQKDVERITERLTEVEQKKDQEERTYLNTVFQTHEDRAAAEAQYNAIKRKLAKDLNIQQIQEIKKSIESSELFPVVKQKLSNEIDSMLTRITENGQWKAAKNVTLISTIVIEIFLVAFPIMKFDDSPIRFWGILRQVFFGGTYFWQCLILGADLGLLILYLLSLIIGINDQDELKNAVISGTLLLFVAVGIVLILRFFGENIVFMPAFTICLIINLLNLFINKALKQT